MLYLLYCEAKQMVYFKFQYEFSLYSDFPHQFAKILKISITKIMVSANILINSLSSDRSPYSHQFTNQNKSYFDE